MSRPHDNGLDQSLQQGWQSACALYQHLRQGGEVPELPPSSLRMDPGERIYGDLVLGYARFYSTNVSYQQSSGFFFGSPAFIAAGLIGTAVVNAASRRRAEVAAAAQWRDHCQVRAVITDRRIFCDVLGRWLSFWHEGVVELAADLTQWSFVARYQVGEPLLLHGPAAPWAAVAFARLVYGPRGLHIPALAPIADAVTQVHGPAGPPVP
ncbi:hypothetical protein [Actinopolymorpha alba]|uniref:hypothetical protein n=1 Tax=Actinopolymorpha alba TaxID=533267 RepID=UPI00037CF8E9|nr:hypothetical protein [Actinopolymorpha alba]